MQYRQRHGTIYLITMGTALIVSVLAMAALLAVRIQRREVDDIGDVARAQFYARAAVDMALLRIETDSDWRTKLAAGTWEVEQAIDDGSYSFRGMDPIDGDLTDESGDPVEIIGTGQSGPARQMLQVRIRVKQPGMRCLEPAIHAEKNLKVEDTTVTSDHFISSNDKVEVKSGSEVYADAEAASEVKVDSDCTVYGTTTTDGDWPREMPDKDTVFDYYETNGTWIDVNDLPLWDRNLIDNPGAEEGVTPWYGVGCSISQSTTEHSGTYSIRVGGRNRTSDTVAQDVTEKLRSGETYHAEVEVRSGDDEIDFRLMLKLVSTGDGTVLLPLSSWTSVGESWKKIEGDATVSWTGTLTKAEWYLATNDDEESFRIDDAVLEIADAKSGWRVIHRQVLSPANNPFGPGTTNAQGLYVIDCDGEKLSIKDSRISGTLVLLDANGDTTVEGGVVWSPATVGSDPVVPNLPALMTNKTIHIALDSADLDEGQANVNLNPAGTPYEGSEDSDKVDVYPSLLEGVVYSAEKYELENHPVLHGVLVTEQETLVYGPALDVTYDPVYFEDNAPPGFRTDPEIEIVPGSFRQVVD